MTPLPLLREWLRRTWGALSGRRTDLDLDRELAAHLALAEDDLVRRGHTPAEAARLARVHAGGRTQALDALRDQRGLPWLASSLLDLRLGCRLLARHWALTLAGGLAMAVAMAMAAVVFTAFDTVLWQPLPLDEGHRVVAIQMWDREAGQRRPTAWHDVERWRDSLRSLEDVGAFQTVQRNVITPDGSVDLASVAEMSASGFRLARVLPIVGRVLVDADAHPGAAPVVVIGQPVWERRFGSAPDVIGRELRLGEVVHTIVGVMPDGFRFPVNHQYWVPLRPGADDQIGDGGPDGVVFGRLAADATLERAHAEVTALGALMPARDESPVAATHPRVVPYTFAFTGDFDRGELGLWWSLASVLLVLLLLPPCANVAILNYARTVTRQQEFAARHALGGSRARIVFQLFIEMLVLAVGAAAVALLVVHVVSVVIGERLQQIPGGPPFWMTVGVSVRTVLFAAALALVAAGVAGLIPAMQATARLTRLGVGALGGRATLRLGLTWTMLVMLQVAVSAGVLPLALQLCWGTMRTGLVGPGFAAEDYATARVRFDDDVPAGPTTGAPASGSDPRRTDAIAPLRATRQDELARALRADAGIVAVAAALRPPGEEPWVFVDIDGHRVPTETLNGPLPGYRARFNQVEPGFFALYQTPILAGRAFDDGDTVADVGVAIVNRTFAETVAPGGNALGHRFRYAAAMEGGPLPTTDTERWFEIVGVVGNLPATSTELVAYHAVAPGTLRPAQLQMRLRGDTRELAGRLRGIAADVDPRLQVDEVRTLAEIYRERRFGDNLGALAIGAVTTSVVVLAAAGLYALMAFTVAQRRRDIGIRVALGAQPGRLLAAVFGRAFLQVGAGAALGLAAAFVIGRYVPIEQIGGLAIPGILPGTAAFVLLVGAAAAVGPARRGLRVDPTEALRAE